MTHLLQEQFPIDPHSGFLVLPAVFPKSTRNIAHPLQAVPSVQKIFDVLSHDLGHIFKLVIQLAQILRRARVLVCCLRAPDEGIEFDKRIWP